MKIIFLDMDGVLNCYDTTDRIVFPPWNQTFLGLDNDKVQLLSKLVQETGAKVIISSSWRENFKPQELQKTLNERGFTGEVVGETPKSYEQVGFGLPSKRGDRSDEIQAWLAANPGLESFVVVDDIKTRYLDMGRQVQTSMVTGFTQEHYDQALTILNKAL